MGKDSGTEIGALILAYQSEYCALLGRLAWVRLDDFVELRNAVSRCSEEERRRVAREAAEDRRNRIRRTDEFVKQYGFSLTSYVVVKGRGVLRVNEKLTVYPIEFESVRLTDRRLV